MVTGAGGSIGSALAKALIASDPHALVLLDHSEHKLYRVQSELSAAPARVERIPVLGDICDARLVAEVLERYRPEIIYHSAAFKHVPLMEANPLAAIRNNVVGTLTLARAAAEQRTPTVLMISTDKAANPRSVMGASKRIAELVLARLTSIHARMNAVRLGNVFGSEGSVVPLFREQISRRAPVTVTHPDATRYFVTMDQAVEIVTAVGALEEDGAIFVPAMGDPVAILDLARRLIKDAGLRPDVDVPIIFTGLRPGDKLTEDLTSADEFLEATSDPELYRVRASKASPEDFTFDSLLSDLMEALHSRDVAALLELVSHLVPEYHPGEFLLRSLACSPV